MIEVRIAFDEIAKFGVTTEQHEAGINRKMAEAGIPVEGDWKVRGSGYLKVWSDFAKSELVIQWRSKEEVPA